MVSQTFSCPALCSAKSNPSAYPIYDGFVDQILWTYNKQDKFDTFLRQDSWKYHRFRQIVDNFRMHYELTEFDLKDIDKFLWLAGKDYYSFPLGRLSIGIFLPSTCF